jgi:hypothetical protein
VLLAVAIETPYFKNKKTTFALPKNHAQGKQVYYTTLQKTSQIKNKKNLLVFLFYRSRFAIFA